jgi:uncharacterized phiE125 gp8 family phage protein
LPDAVANDLIEMARITIEDMAGVAMVTQTWLMAFDRWPGGRDIWWNGVRDGHIMIADGDTGFVELTRWPLISVDGVNTYDTDDTATAANVSTTFQVDTYSKPGRMGLKFGQSWPIALRRINAIEVTYTAGYGGASDVPATLRQAILKLAAFEFDHAGECSASDAYALSGARADVNRFRNVRI